MIHLILAVALILTPVAPTPPTPKRSGCVTTTTQTRQGATTLVTTSTDCGGRVCTTVVRVLPNGKRLLVSDSCPAARRR